MAWTRRRRQIRLLPRVSRISVMGTVACQEIYGIDGALAAERAERELYRLDALWSPCRPDNIIEAIRKAAGSEPVRADPDTVQLLRAARSLGIASAGAFDITADPLIRLWREAARVKRPPDRAAIETLRCMVCIEELKIEPDGRVYLPRRGQGVDLGGIGKGYAADRLRDIYQEAGIRHAIINIGGNVLVINSRPDGLPWKVGIRDPACPHGRLVGYMEAVNCSVVTSGGYERFFDYEDPVCGKKRFHHIIDPRTGWPAESGIAAVTVVSASSALADALATAAFVLGPERGLSLCDSYNDTHVLIIEPSGALRMSAGMRKRFTKAAVRLCQEI